jgi:hypothetical protein
MKNMSRLLAAAALFAATGVTHAVTLVPNTFVNLPGTTSAAEPQLAGLVLEDVVTPFAFSDGRGTISGTVQSRVVRSDLDGTLDFYWRVVMDANANSAVGSFRIGNFFAPEYNANWRTDGLGNVAPNSAYLFSSPAGAVNYMYNSANGGGSLGAGKESYFMLMDTTATKYNMSGVYDLANFGQTRISELFPTFAPAVPEPETYGMMLAGLAAIGLAARRRRG